MDSVRERTLGSLSPARRGVVIALLGAGAVLTAALGSHVVADFGGANADKLFNDWVVSLVSVVAFLAAAARAAWIQDDRRPWACVALGLGSYAAGTLLWSFKLDELPEPPFPSVADGMWLLLYPMLYVGMVGRARRTLGRLSSSAWLDGLVAALAGGALLAAFVYEPLLTTSTGAPQAIATNIAYPLFDLILLGTALLVLVARGRRPDAGWALLGLGALALAGADSLFANQVAAGSYVPGGVPNVLWSTGLVLVAASAWTNEQRDGGPHAAGRGALAVPTLFALFALGLLVVDGERASNWVTVVTAAGAILCALLRLALTVHEAQALARSREEALTDDLTGLPNRRALLRHLGASGPVSDDALLLVDLDGFKDVNDALGHNAGDAVLATVARRLRVAAPPEAFVSRLSGDEFAVALRAQGTAGGAVALAEALAGALEEPIEVEGLRLGIRCSIGIACAPLATLDSVELLRRADVALYRAKGVRGSWQVYDPSTDEHSRDRLTLIGELRDAVASGAIEEHFQPQVDLRTGRIESVEALARWTHPIRGPISPAVFLPMAERAGLMRPLFLGILGRALSQAAAWEAQGHPIRVAVNLSVTNALDGRLTTDVSAALRAHGVPAACLKLEITEEAFVGDAETVHATLQELVALGVGISMDDYGSAEGSLARLKGLPIEELKIDRHFAAGVAQDPVDYAIVASTIDLCRRLGVRVVAEGVEDLAAVATLRELCCDLVQGYATGRPVPASEIGLDPATVGTATLREAPPAWADAPARATPASVGWQVG